MAVESITLNIPKHVYERAQELAESTHTSLEEVFLHQLENAFSPILSPQEEATLAALNPLSNDILWVIAREKMALPLQERMQTLMDKNSLGTINSEEYEELEALVEQGQQLTLKKSEAMALLAERGYTITRESLGD